MVLKVFDGTSLLMREKQEDGADRLIVIVY